MKKPLKVSSPGADDTSPSSKSAAAAETGLDEPKRDDAMKRGDAQQLAHADHVLGEDSPYEEVRAAVRNTDHEQVASTVRAWILGIIFVTVGSGLNMFLSMRCAVPPSRK
jgi:hypothetical protein